MRPQAKLFNNSLKRKPVQSFHGRKQSLFHRLRFQQISSFPLNRGWLPCLIGNDLNVWVHYIRSVPRFPTFKTRSQSEEIFLLTHSKGLSSQFPVIRLLSLPRPC